MEARDRDLVVGEPLPPGVGLVAEEKDVVFGSRLKDILRAVIARYLLARGVEQLEEEGDQATPLRTLAAVAKAKPTKLKFVFPDGLAPTPAPLAPAPDISASLPGADVVVITWTVDELAALARVLTPSVSPTKWYRYARNFDAFKPKIRPHASSVSGKPPRLGSYFPITIGQSKVLCMKSELHLNQDGIKIGEGTATLPVKDLFKQIISETEAKLVLTGRHRRVGLR